ncbi:hypothetical protein HNQ79_004087 [Streptomyces candidus]|uniref:Uncharacterized protein n=1 Tax=Streptomyces candidus TaxID=67283 RepID=A0A7X0HH76_9ACTN|nr:hypothetical protein [Streptomyces candidus]
MTGTPHPRYGPYRSYDPYLSYNPMFLPEGDR